MYSEGGFKEGVSLTVVDELAQWQKYAYGNPPTSASVENRRLMLERRLQRDHFQPPHQLLEF